MFVQASAVREALGLRLQATSRSSPMLAAGGRRTLMRAVSSSRWAAVGGPAMPACFDARLQLEVWYSPQVDVAPMASALRGG